ncbi:MAG: sigma-54-dependent Fis family transcriptional regulator [Ignavibacteria bacterium]|nr:sigma-54-dependent Fis family transcriptional regulator [Ignavibacteria bacterium]
MMQVKILIVDDEPVICQSCEKIFLRAGHLVKWATSGKQAFKILEEEQFDIVFTDLKMPDIGGMEVIREVKFKYPDTIIVVITGYATIASAVETMRYGAYDYLPKPFTPNELLAVLNKAIERKKLIKTVGEKFNYTQSLGFEGIIGKSSQMCEIYTLIDKVAPTDSTVLILGESGTGKDLTAQAIHNRSNRKDKGYFAVDISTLSGTLLESELFGHTKGSFTGAYSDKKGIFEATDGGTIFLDEIGNLSLEVQASLLRVIQEKEYIPVGSTVTKKVDVRLIFATNQNLKKLADEGSFREDLYYRLNVFPIKLPALRERKEDIPELVMFFLNKYSDSMNKSVNSIDLEAMDMLQNYHWPGNVRELQHTIERLVIISETNEIKPIDITNALYKSDRSSISNIPKTIYDLNALKKQIRETSIFEIEKLFLIEALKRNDWNISHAAKDVSMQRPNFQTLMKKYGIKKPDGEEIEDN